MNATLVHVRDPFRPHVNRDIHRLSRRTRIDTLLRRQGLIAGRGRKMRRLSNFVVTTDGKNYLLDNQWKRCIEDGEVLTVIAVPAGGNAWRQVALVVVMIAAAYVSGGGAVGTFGAGTLEAGSTGALLAGAAVAAAGTMLVAAVLPEVRK